MEDFVEQLPWEAAGGKGPCKRRMIQRESGQCGVTKVKRVLLRESETAANTGLTLGTRKRYPLPPFLFIRPKKPSIYIEKKWNKTVFIHRWQNRLHRKSQRYANKLLELIKETKKITGYK